MLQQMFLYRFELEYLTIESKYTIPNILSQTILYNHSDEHIAIIYYRSYIWSNYTMISTIINLVIICSSTIMIDSDMQITRIPNHGNIRSNYTS